MFFGFWSWILVIIAVAAIFAANRLPELQAQAKEKLKEGAEAVKKGQQDFQKKINEKVKEQQEKIKAAKKEESDEDEDDDDDEDKADATATEAGKEEKTPSEQ